MRFKDIKCTEQQNHYLVFNTACVQWDCSIFVDNTNSKMPNFHWKIAENVEFFFKNFNTNQQIEFKPIIKEQFFLWF